MAVAPEKGAAWEWVDEHVPWLSDFHRTIWDLAEPAWREYRSAAAYVDLLRSEGFDVEVGSGEMPTAFMATWGTGEPVLGAYAEYDAVPGTSQAPVPYRAPRPGLHPYAAGHTDPHSALGVGALAGVLAAKHAMERHKLPGTLRFFGEPAEKVCGSKPVHAAKGYYDGVDAFISYHPWFTNTTILDTMCGSYWSCVFTFELIQETSWIDPALLSFPANPHAVPRPPGALDAISLMIDLTEHTREGMYANTGTWTLNEFIMAAGQATADNLAPHFGQIQYAWRAPNLGIQQQIYKVLENNARCAAQATSCMAHVRWVTKTRVGLPNHVMAAATYRNLELVGPPVFGDEARAFGREIQRTLGIDPMEDPFTTECATLMTPEQQERETRRGLPEWQTNFTSDDYVEYTWHAPTVRLYTGRPMMRRPHEWSHWAHNALNGISAAIDPTWHVAGKTIGATLVDLLTNPGLRAAARDEFEQRTGGGVGGDRWSAPLLPRDFAPPVDLPWPEYVDTVRGREWRLPTTHTFGTTLAPIAHGRAAEGGV
jgi:aminobenzoyl-glutamate utilization protein B